MPTINTLHAPPPIRAGLYAVGLFDLLGQSNALAPFVGLSGPPEYMPTMQVEFGRIVSQVYAFREDFKSFFEGAEATKLVNSAPSSAPQEALALAAQMDSPEIKLQGFSDTVIAYVPLALLNGESSLYKLGSLLLSSVGTMLMSLARGVVVRGAIEASWAMEPYNGEVYGPALMCAYELERTAGWPRIVLGGNVGKLLQRESELGHDSMMAAMNAILAKQIAGMSFKDVDGKLAVDYLAPSVLAFLRDAVGDLQSLIDAAHVGLERQYEKHADNPKVRGQLRSALDYFELRTGVLNDGRRSNALFYAKLRHPT
jgi:hypothetical protein